MQISEITKDNILDKSVFEFILSIVDEIERAEITIKVGNIAKKFKVHTDFKNMLNLYTDKQKKESKNNMKIISVKNIPIENLEINEYECSINGIKDIKGNCICPHLIIPAERFINTITGNEKIKLSFYKDKKWKNIVVNKEVISSANKIVSLSNKGIEVNTLTATALIKYLSDVININIDKIPCSLSTNKCGWNNGEFIPYVDNIKYDGDINFETIYNSIKEKGSYKKWLEEMNIVRKNKIVKLLHAVSFASPLLELLSLQIFVTVLYGTTGDGKTVAGMTAMSIWGDPAEGKLTNTLNNTNVYINRILGFLNNIPFFADELETNRSEDINKLIMNMTEGIERGKGTVDGGIQEKNTWKNTIIFTGEDSATKFNSGGGTKNRVIEINSTGQIIENGNRTATCVRNNYGFAGKKFIEIIKNKNFKERYDEILRDIKLKKKTETKQAQSMAVILLADELACGYIFENEKPLIVDDVLDFMFDSTEIDISNRALEFLTDFVGMNKSKFLPSNETYQVDLWGRLSGNELYISKSKLEEIMEQNKFPINSIIKKWANNGILNKNSQGRNYHLTSINNVKANFYSINLPI